MRRMKVNNTDYSPILFILISKNFVWMPRKNMTILSASLSMLEYQYFVAWLEIIIGTSSHQNSPSVQSECQRVSNPCRSRTLSKIIIPKKGKTKCTPRVIFNYVPRQGGGRVLCSKTDTGRVLFIIAFLFIYLSFESHYWNRHFFLPSIAKSCWTWRCICVAIGRRTCQGVKWKVERSSFFGRLSFFFLS